ncbi:hypothetical protein EI94DRAFT_1703547 [Lactarius quietus]|nr:hypothetical protein EI94DRAFT_1703547 [Lactarius quietus]
MQFALHNTGDELIYPLELAYTSVMLALMAVCNAGAGVTLVKEGKWPNFLFGLFFFTGLTSAAHRPPKSSQPSRRVVGHKTWHRKTHSQSCTSCPMWWGVQLVWDKATKGGESSIYCCLSWRNPNTH